MNLPDKNSDKYKSFKASPGAQKLIDDLYEYCAQYNRLLDTNHILIVKLDNKDMEIKEQELMIRNLQEVLRH